MINLHIQVFVHRPTSCIFIIVLSITLHEMVMAILKGWIAGCPESPHPPFPPKMKKRKKIEKVEEKRYRYIICCATNAPPHPKINHICALFACIWQMRKFTALVATPSPDVNYITLNHTDQESNQESDQEFDQESDRIVIIRESNVNWTDTSAANHLE